MRSTKKDRSASRPTASAAVAVEEPEEQEEDRLECPVQERHLFRVTDKDTGEVLLFLILDIPGFFRHRVGPFENEAEVNKYLGRLMNPNGQLWGDFWCEVTNALYRSTYDARDAIEDEFPFPQV